MSSIRADMQLNAAPFIGAIGNVQRQIRNLQVVTAGITGAFVAARAAMAGVSNVMAQLKGALDLGGQLSDLSASTGASVSELVVLRQALQNAGMGAEAAGPMIARFQKALAGVNEDGVTTKGILEELGINTLALSRMPLQDQFTELSRVISAIPDPADRAAAAIKLFGRSGVEMLAFMRDPKAFETAAAQVGELGNVLEANASRFDSVSDAIEAMGLKINQFFVGFMSEISGLGMIEDLSKMDFTGLGQSVGQMANSIVAMTASLRPLVPLFATLGAAVLASKSGLTEAAITAGGQVPGAIASMSAAVSSARANLVSMGLAARAAFASVASDAQRAAASAASLGPVSVSMRAAFAPVAAAFAPVAAAITSPGAALASLGATAQTTFASLAASARQAATAMSTAIGTAAQSSKASVVSLGASMRSSMVNMGASARATASAISSSVAGTATSVSAAMANPRATLAGFAASARASFASMTVSARAAAAGSAAAITSSMAMTRTALVSVGVAARSAFTAMVASARAAGVAMKGALVSTGIGAAVVAIGMAIEAVMAKFNRMEEGTRAQKNVGAESSRLLTNNATKIKSVSNEEERQTLMAELDSQIEETRRRVANLNDEFENLDDDALAAVAEQLSQQVNWLERQKKTLSAITPEYMAQVAAVRAKEQALADAKRKAEELRAETQRALETRDADMRRKGLETAPVDQAREQLLREAANLTAKTSIEAVVSVEGIDSVEKAKAAMEAVAQKQDTELKLRAVGLPAAEGMVQMLDSFTGKTVDLALKATGLPNAESLRAALDGINDKNVRLALQSVGLGDVESLKAAIDSTDSKTVQLAMQATGLSAAQLSSIIETVPESKDIQIAVEASGLSSVQELRAALDSTDSKSVVLAMEATGMSDAAALREAIEGTDGKNVKLALQATGLSSVGALRAALDGVPDKTISMALQATGAASIEELQARLTGVPDEKTVSLVMRAVGAESIDEARAKLAQMSGADATFSISPEGVTAEIERLRALGAEITDSEAVRLNELIGLEKELSSVKERQNQEREKALDQEQRLAELQGTVLHDSEVAAAQASGDDNRVRQLEQEKRARDLAKQFEAQGQDPSTAAEIGRRQAELEQLRQEASTATKAPVQVGDSFRQAGLGGGFFAQDRQPQMEMVRKQAESNRLLAEIRSLLASQPQRTVTEVFD